MVEWGVNPLGSDSRPTLLRLHGPQPTICENNHTHCTPRQCWVDRPAQRSAPYCTLQWLLQITESLPPISVVTVLDVQLVLSQCSVKDMHPRIRRDTDTAGTWLPFQVMPQAGSLAEKSHREQRSQTLYSVKCQFISVPAKFPVTGPVIGPA